MLNPTFPPSTSSGGGSDPALVSRVAALEISNFSLSNRVLELENQRTEAWVFEDIRVDSTVTFETTVDLPPFVGDLTGLTIEVAAPDGTFIHTFATTPTSLADLVTEVSETLAPSTVTFEITGSDPQNGLLFYLPSEGQGIGFNLDGTALPNLGFEAGYFTSEQVLRHFAAGADGVFNIAAQLRLDITLAAMTAEIEALKAQVSALGGA